MPPTLDDLRAERDALRAMLGEPGEPVYLDLKPGPLTRQERRQFAGRLGEVNRQLDCLNLLGSRFGRCWL